MSTVSKRKQKRSDIEAYYRNESKTFWFGPCKIWTEADHFDLVQSFFFKVGSFLFWPKDSGTKQNNLFWSRNCLRQSGTFLFNPKSKRSNQNVLMWCKNYLFNCRSFLFCPKNFGTKQNNLIWSKNCLRQSGTLLVNPKTDRLKQNVLNWYKNFFCLKQIVSFLAKNFWDKAKQFNLVRKLSKLNHNSGFKAGLRKGIIPKLQEWLF